MPEQTLSKSAVLMVIIVIAAIGSWEIYLRNKGIGITYDDGPPLWSDKRAMVYEPSDRATVFIGSSRIKYDLDIETWQKVTGRHAIQLAILGNSPVPVLEDLGNDPNFRGRLVVDITEGLFFSNSPAVYFEVGDDIRYYHTRTPSQKASFKLNHALESQFVFLDADFLSLNGQLAQLNVPDRPNVFKGLVFPLDFSRTGFDRQTKMSPKFLSDTSLQNKVKDNWIYIANVFRHAPPPPGDPVSEILKTVKDAVDKIRRRGGEVIFLRTPDSGPMRDGDQHAFPRSVFWDHLLAVTHCRGFFYADYPAIDHFECPEWSHLSPHDAVLFTETLTKILPASFVH